MLNITNRIRDAVVNGECYLPTAFDFACDPITLDLTKAEGHVSIRAGLARIHSTDPSQPLLTVIGQSNPKNGLRRFFLDGGEWVGGLEFIDVSFSHVAPLSVEYSPGPGVRYVVRHQQCENNVLGGTHCVRFINNTGYAVAWDAENDEVGEMSHARFRGQNWYVHGSAIGRSTGRLYGSSIYGVGGNISDDATDHLFEFNKPANCTTIRDLDVEGTGDDRPFCVERHPQGQGGLVMLDGVQWRWRVGKKKPRYAEQHVEVVP